MNTILAAIFPIMGSLTSTARYDVAPGPFIILGLAFILVVGAAIVFLIILVVRLLRRLRNKKNNNV